MLFPGGRLPLKIFETRYMDMARACLKDGSAFGVCLIREGRDVGAPALPHEVGTLATIGHWDMAQLGVLNIVARGGARFRILERRVQADGLARASIAPLADASDAAIPAESVRCVKILERIIADHGELFELPHHLDSSAWVGARLAELLPLPLGLKQELLEMDDGAARLAKINALLAAPPAAP